MLNVLVRGPLLSKSGYGEHCRQVLKYLMTKDNLKITCQVLPWGITPWYINPEDLGGLVGKIIGMSSYKENQKFDVSFQVQLPNEWDTSVASKNIGVTAGVETTAANPMWINTHCQKMDAVIVPSQHTKKALQKTGSCTTPIKVVPESYFEELMEKPGELDLNVATSFNFLTVGVMTGFTPQTDRKNLMYLIKWFVEEFKNEEDVGLIIKTNRGRDTSIDRVGTVQILKKVLSELNHKGTPKIYLLHGPMDRDEMNSLYKHPKVKAFVSLTRGEGFGLPHLEAAVSKLPVIATNWSAHTEFLNQGEWIKVDYNMEKVHESRIDNTIFMEGSSWAFPQETSAKKAMRNFYKYSKKGVRNAKKLGTKLAETHSEETTWLKYDEAIGEFLL